MKIAGRRTGTWSEEDGQCGLSVPSLFPGRLPGAQCLQTAVRSTKSPLSCYPLPPLNHPAVDYLGEPNVTPEACNSGRGN